MRNPDDILEQDEILFGCNGGKISQQPLFAFQKNFTETPEMKSLQ